jgi:hypothetical protein
MILFLNHKTKNCGVYQFGERIGTALLLKTKYQVLYYEIDSIDEFEHVVGCHKPEAVIYNYYPSTMPWLNNPVLKGHSGVAHICIFHEVPTNIFDYYIHVDPTFVDSETHFGIDRLLPDYTNTQPPTEVMTIGTFGFGLGGKNYNSLVKKVNSEFDEAIVRLHIPFAAFGDSTGHGARHWVELCKREITKPGISLDVSHEFLSEQLLLSWLGYNTMNAFYYDEMYGRGCASVTDYALAVDRPLAITKSYMFRHLHPFAPEICMEDNSLADIAARGTEPLEQFTIWNRENFIRRFEVICDSIENIKPR